MGYRNWYLTEVIWLYLWVGNSYYEPDPIYSDEKHMDQWDHPLSAKELNQLEAFSYVFRTWDQLTGSIPFLGPEHESRGGYIPPREYKWEARIAEHLRGGESNFRTTSIHPLSTDEGRSPETLGYFCHVCGLWDLHPQQECRGCSISANLMFLALEQIAHAIDDLKPEFYKQLQKARVKLRIDAPKEDLDNPHWR